MKGVNLELLDPNASASQIRVRSAAVGDGYFPEPDEEKLGDGIFVPDDLLARDGSGFKIVGRISDVINVAGKKVNPAEVEAHLLRFSGVRQAVVFGRPAGPGACAMKKWRPAWWQRPDVSETDLLQFCRGGAKQLGRCRSGFSSWTQSRRMSAEKSAGASSRDGSQQTAGGPHCHDWVLDKAFIWDLLKREEHHAEIIRRTQVNRS